MTAIKNPIKFVKVMNTGSGITQVIPLSTWERLSQQSPKSLRKVEFICACDENGDSLPAIEKLTTPVKPKKDGKAEKGGNTEEK
jgi:hypothetical protein